MLQQRLISAAILISLVVALLFLDYNAVAGIGTGVWLLPLLLFFAIGTAMEVSQVVVLGGGHIRRTAAVAGAACTVLASTVPLVWEATGNPYPPNCPVGRLGWLSVGALLGLLITIGTEMSAFQAQSKVIASRVGASAWVTLYVGLPMAFLVVIRGLGANDPGWGIAALVSFIAVTKSCDSGAYLTGKLIGGHKLIPRLSPGKTWEGAIGGVAASIGVAYACRWWLFPWLATAPLDDVPAWGPLLLGITCALAGMFGDLAESLFKRDAGVKDSGRIIPGMGGVWDVTDSLIGASLPAFLCFAAGGMGAIP